MHIPEIPVYCIRNEVDVLMPLKKTRIHFLCSVPGILENLSLLVLHDI